MASQGTQEASHGSSMPPGSLALPSSRSVTPTLLPGLTTPNAQACAPNQPQQHPLYKSPYSHPAPFPAPNYNQNMAPAPGYSQNIPQSRNPPGSIAPATLAPLVPLVPAISQHVLQGSNETQYSAGYIAYSNELRRAVAKNKVRSARLTPVEHVQNVLSIVSDTVCVPTLETQLAGVMAGNPMINSVKVIMKLTELNEDLADKIDDRDAYIRHQVAVQMQIQASQTHLIQHAVEQALREAVRPLPKPTEKQAADLRDKDDKILALQNFIKDQAKRITDLEAERDFAQGVQYEQAQHIERALSFGHGQGHSPGSGNDQVQIQDFLHGQIQNFNRAQDHSPGSGNGQVQNFNRAHDYSPGSGNDQVQSQDFLQGQIQNFNPSQNYNPGSRNGQARGQGFLQGQIQNFSQDQGFDDIAQALGPEFSFTQYPDVSRGYSSNLDLSQGPTKFSFDDGQSFGAPQDMGGPGMWFQHGLGGQPTHTNQQMMRNLHSMEDPFFSPPQPDLSSQPPQQMATRPSPKSCHIMQGQRNTPPPIGNRRQQTPNQQSPSRSQGAPSKRSTSSKRKSSTPHRGQKKPKEVDEEEKLRLDQLRNDLRNPRITGKYQDGFKRSF